MFQIKPHSFDPFAVAVLITGMICDMCLFEWLSPPANCTTAPRVPRVYFRATPPKANKYTLERFTVARYMFSHTD